MVGFRVWFWWSIFLNDRQPPNLFLLLFIIFYFPSHLVFSTSLKYKSLCLFNIYFSLESFPCCRNLLDFLFLITNNSSKHFHVVLVWLVKLFHISIRSTYVLQTKYTSVLKSTFKVSICIFMVFIVFSNSKNIYLRLGLLNQYQ